MPDTKLENPLLQTLKHGQSLWYDGLIGIAEFRRMIREDGLRGATTNPAIFEKALSGDQYDAEIRTLAATQSDEQIYQTLAVRAVQDVADAFLPVYQETKGLDGYVSIEVSPLLARDTDGTLREARELWRAVRRPNVMIKIPATREGLPAITAALADGINVNVTLIFSVERYREVMDAYIRGLEKRASLDFAVTGIASVASFFVSRVDSAVDAALAKKIAAGEKGLEPLLGRAAIANSKLAYDEFKKVFGGFRFQKLRTRGANVQRPLWASTGTKNPAYSDVLYVESLIGPDTVNTMPPPTLDAYRDHGSVPADVPSPVESGVEDARLSLEALSRSGIDLATVTQDLEQAGVELFCDAYRKIIKGIGAKR